MSDLLNDILGLAKESKEISNKSRRGKQLAKKFAEAEAEAARNAEAARLAAEELRWKVRAVVHIKHVVTCTHCGATYESPNLYPMLRKENPLVGVHYIPIKDALELRTTYSGTPKVLETYHASVDTCFACAADEYGLVKETYHDA